MLLPLCGCARCGKKPRSDFSLIQTFFTNTFLCCFTHKFHYEEYNIEFICGTTRMCSLILRCLSNLVNIPMYVLHSLPSELMIEWLWTPGGTFLGCWLFLSSSLSLPMLCVLFSLSLLCFPIHSPCFLPLSLLVALFFFGDLIFSCLTSSAWSDWLMATQVHSPIFSAS